MRFRDKVRKAKRPVVVYEILPPREKDGTLDSYAEKISSLLSQTHIDAINIPEVHDENERGERPIQNLERAEAREFGRLLQDNVGIEAIVNRVTVHEDLQTQTDWIRPKGVEYYAANLYPYPAKLPTDIYVLTEWGDRLDLLAEQFYGNQHLWFYIAKVNGINTITVDPGTKIRIPKTFPGIK